MKQFEQLQRFCQAFEAEALKSDRRFYKREVVSWSEYNDPKVHFDTKIVEAVAIHIPEHRLNDFLQITDEQRYKEMHIRDNVPAVKKAYENYKLLLKMCGGDYDARY